MDTTTELKDSIKACRTCGIHFVTPPKHQLKHLFQSCQEHSEIMRIRLELAQWNIEVSENDGFPQYICNSCIHKFEQVFQLRTACINAQNEFRKFYAVPNGNIKIKSEVPDADEESAVCDFIYVDDLSDGEYDGATPFNIPHIPIKEELIEAAAVPVEDSGQPLNAVESASSSVIPANALYSLENNFVKQNASATDVKVDGVLPISTNIFECSSCHQTFSNQEDHKHHLKEVHDISDLECHICGKVFKNSSSARLKFHMKWHTLSRQIKCNICSFVCRSKDALSSHKRTNHTKVNCKICGKGVLAKKMKSHLHQHDLQQKYPCEYCREAFATENERENHIWGVHAAEDDAATRSEINFQPCYTQINNDNTSNMKPEETVCQEPQENFLYKYICAHCEHRFLNQMDFETHVKEEHLANFEARTAVDTPQIEILQNFEENAVFKEYDDDGLPVTSINCAPVNSTVLTKDVHSATFENSVIQNENVQDQTKLISYSSLDEDSDATETADEVSILSTYIEGGLNTFSCAKCSETFATVDQLREHHAQHLAAEQQSSNTFLTKCEFKCNFCEKTFDLKFRLNRHINKHKKHAPI